MAQEKHRLAPHSRAMLLAAAVIGIAGCATPAAREEVYITRVSARTPVDVHQAIRHYVTQKGWLYVNDNKLKGGEITQVRICDPKAAANIWKAGLQVSAMMPCGHLSIYQEGGMTRLTMLHPRFLTLLDPHPAVKELADAVTGPYLVMMDEVTR